MKTNEAIISDVNARHLRRRIRKMNASLMESFVKLYTHSYEENVAFFSLFLVFFGLLFFSLFFSFSFFVYVSWQGVSALSRCAFLQPALSQCASCSMLTPRWVSAIIRERKPSPGYFSTCPIWYVKNVKATSQAVFYMRIQSRIA